MQGLAQALGAPLGSLYHRFASREDLLRQLWLRVVREFQDEFAHRISEAERPGQVARWTLEWVREHPQEARLLLLFRRQEFSAEISGALDGELKAAMQLACKRWPQASRHTLQAALIYVPYALFRPVLEAGGPPPNKLAELADSTAEFLVNHGS